MEKYEAWTKRVNELRGQNLRIGQRLMIALKDVDEGFYAMTIGTGLDCFYDDRICEKLMNAFMVHCGIWGDENDNP